MKKLILALFTLFCFTAQAQWTESLNKPATCLYSTGTGYPTYAGLSGGYIVKTTNNGVSWFDVDTIPFGVNCITKGSTYFLVGSSKGIYKTTDTSMRNFQRLSTFDTTLAVLSLCANYEIILAGTSNGLYRSTNYGVNWEIPQLGGLGVNGVDRGISTNEVYASTTNGIYRSTNDGVSWTVWTQTIGQNVKFTKYPGLSALVAGTSTGYLWSTNSGANWFSVSRPATLCWSNAGSPEFLMGDISGNVMHGTASNPSAASWTVRNAGLPTTSINALCWSGDYVYAGSSGTTQKIWRALKSYTIDVKQISSDIPAKYELGQNYPNPFNPTTTIRYQIPKAQIVTLKIYDIAGKELETLINENQSPGTYVVNLNAGKYSSGVYFYKIESENFTDTKRMLLVK